MSGGCAPRFSPHDHHHRQDSRHCQGRHGQADANDPTVAAITLCLAMANPERNCFGYDTIEQAQPIA